MPAIELIGEFLEQTRPRRALWLLDSPVSNSGRLKSLIGRLAQSKNWEWEIELVTNPDARLIKSENIVASSDSVILDGCKRWVNLAAEIIKSSISDVKTVDLRAKS